MNHVKKSSCDCGFKFYDKKIQTVNKLVGKSPKNAPQKECPGCKSLNHVKVATCVCGHSFYKAKFKPQIIQQDKSVNGEKMNTTWKDLSIGDIIKSVNGHGPFWLNTRNQEKTYMGSYGKFKIVKILDDGIMGVSYNQDTSKQFEFLYMGEVVPSKNIDNFYRAPHKLFRLKKRGNNE
jgi:hypothetical protein